MPQWLLNLILRFVAPELGKLVQSFLSKLEKERADDPTVIAAVRTIVDTIDKQHPEWEWTDKIAYASDRALEYLVNVGKDVSRAAVNSLIDLVVVHKRETEPLPDKATRLLGSTGGNP